MNWGFGSQKFVQNYTINIEVDSETNFRDVVLNKKNY